MFVDLKGVEILQKNLYKNFVMHVCNLCDYGLVSPEVQYKTIRKLQRLWSTCESSQKILVSANEKQLKYWNDIGYHKQQLQLQQQQLEQQQKKEAAAAAAAAEETREPKVIIKKEKDSKLKDERSMPKDDKHGLLSSIKKPTTRLMADEQQSHGRRKCSIQSKEKDKTTGNSNNSGGGHTQSQEHGTNKRKFQHLRGKFFEFCY